MNKYGLETVNFSLVAEMGRFNLSNLETTVHGQADCGTPSWLGFTTLNRHIHNLFEQCKSQM